MLLAIEQGLSQKREFLPRRIEFYLLARLRSRFVYPSGYSCLAQAGEEELSRSIQIHYRHKKSSPLSLPAALAKSSIIVNSGLARGFGSVWFSSVQYSGSKVFQEVDGALQNADRILFTEAGLRSMSLAARSVHIYHFREALYLTAGQRHSFRIRQSGFPPAVLETIPIHSRKPLRLLAPGLLLWQPDFLRKDQQWVWVRLQNGRSYLLLGTDWPSKACLFGKKAPPRIWFFRHGIRPENYWKARRALYAIRRFFARLGKPLRILFESR